MNKNLICRKQVPTTDLVDWSQICDGLPHYGILSRFSHYTQGRIALRASPTYS